MRNFHGTNKNKRVANRNFSNREERLKTKRTLSPDISPYLPRLTIEFPSNSISSALVRFLRPRAKLEHWIPPPPHPIHYESIYLERKPSRKCRGWNTAVSVRRFVAAERRTVNRPCLPIRFPFAVTQFRRGVSCVSLHG